MSSSTNNEASILKPEALSKFYRDTLIDNVVPFWFPRAIDGKCGGYLHCLDADGTVIDTDKSIWAQGRMAWMLLTMFNTLAPEPQWLEWGKHGLDFLMKYGSDPEDGRMYFHVTREGQPIRKRRYAYSESFAAIACAAMFRATQDEHWKERATQLFDQYLSWNFTPGRMPAKFCATRPMTGIGPRMIAIATAQSLRSDLSYDASYQGCIDRMIDEIERLFVKHDLQAVLESVAEDGSIVDHFDGRTLNPGHSIEAAWFVLEEAKHQGDARLTKLGCQMVDYSWHQGWDHEYGGLYYFRDLYDRPVQEYWHDMKFWWPHNEAIIATLFAHQMSDDEKYAKWHQQVHDWSFQHFADAQHGEWFGYLHRDGRLSNTIKGGMWKSFFHYPRMLWKCWSLLEGK